jgi:hypothetical protein
MNYGKKRAKKYDPRSMGKDTTGSYVMQEVMPSAPTPRPYRGGLPKPRPKFNVQTGKYVSE